MNYRPPKLYSTLASWWPILSSPDDYKEEATAFIRILRKKRRNCRDVLELGSGGGNNASYLKKHFHMTLVDISPQMIKVSKRLNPECRHLIGDMRSVGLNQTFDAVFIHDAIMYITTESDLEKVFRTAARHLRRGGGLLVVPDFFKENFTPKTSHGGHDRGRRSLRYLEWIIDLDPHDNIFETHFAYLLKEGKKIRLEYDRHINGVFPRAVWLRLIKRAGFDVEIIPIDLSDLEPGTYNALWGRRL